MWYNFDMNIENPIENIKEFTKENTNISLDKLEDILKKYELENIHSDFVEKISLLVIAALGIITAVSWDQVLKMVALSVFDGVSDAWLKLLYAVSVTTLTVMVSIILNKIFMKRGKKASKKNIVELLRKVANLSDKK